MGLRKIKEDENDELIACSSDEKWGILGTRMLLFSANSFVVAKEPIGTQPRALFAPLPSRANQVAGRHASYP